VSIARKASFGGATSLAEQRKTELQTVRICSIVDV
jgi:hypothetical protein